MPAAWGRRQGRADEDKSIATKLTVLFDSGGEEAENAVDGGGGSSSGSNGDSLWCADSRSGIERNEWERGRAVEEQVEGDWWRNRAEKDCGQRIWPVS